LLGYAAFVRKARCNVRKIVPKSLLLVLTAFVLSPPPSAQWKTPWTYDGPTGYDHWADLDRDYAPCKLGKEQSPIDIVDAEKADLPQLCFAYKSAPLKYLINNGYTIRVNYHDVAGEGNFLVVGDNRYQLTQFHFHHPSEELIRGRSYPMVAHFMHQSKDGKVVGVSVLINVGSPNTTVQQLWEHMPRTKSREVEIPGVEINPAGLVPQNTSYYMYMGSLTAPPCTEGVTWFVLKTPLTISAEQITAFAELYPRDIRPVQPLNGRIVKESR
jgi:carbonic anhydrase